jgi:hypothetical protein
MWGSRKPFHHRGHRGSRRELAIGAADGNWGAARQAKSDDKNHQQDTDGSDSGVSEEIDENVIETHGDEYGPC